MTDSLLILYKEVQEETLKNIEKLRNKPFTDCLELIKTTLISFNRNSDCLNISLLDIPGIDIKVLNRLIDHLRSLSINCEGTSSEFRGVPSNFYIKIYF